MTLSKSYIEINDIKKISWALRRGMLELDILLSNFFNQCYQKLSEVRQKTFIDLLEQPDPLIFSWIMGTAHPDHSRFADITQLIRQHASNRI